MSQDRLLRQFLSKLVLILDLLNRVMPKSQIEAKLDQIIEKLDGLTARVDRIEKSVTGVQRQVIEVDAKLSKRCEALELSLQKKAETAGFLELKIQVEDLAKQRVEEREVMIKQQQMITQLTNQLQGYKQTTERENLSREAYSKRFNLLVHGLEEDQTNPWKNRTVTENLLKKFFIQGLKLENPEQINIVDLHRLPQYCGVSKGSALRLRLIGSVVQPLSCYDLLSYKAIGSNYLSFVVASMLVFHIATG